MPRGAGRRLPKLLGLLGGVGGGGIGWHFATIYADPPGILFYTVEAVLLTVVMVLLLTTPHSPQTPNLNLIPQLTNAH